RRAACMGSRTRGRRACGRAAGAVSPVDHALDLPAAAHARGSVTLPGSKSISNRTLVLAALAEGDTVLEGLLDADDVTRMREALTALGVRIDADGARCIVHGTDGTLPNGSAELFLGNAGTAFRPLTAVLALAGGSYP